MPDWNFSDMSWASPLFASLTNLGKNTDLKPQLEPNFNNAFKFDLNPIQDFVKSTFNAQSNLEARNSLLKKEEIKKKNLDPNAVLISTDASKLIGEKPALLNTDPMETWAKNKDIINNAGSVSQSLGQWGDFGVQAGLILGSMVGGKAGKAISNAATGTLTTINAVKNLKSLKGVEGAGLAKGGNYAAIAGAVAGIADSFIGEKSEYSGDKGELTLTLDSVYDGIADAAMSMGPWGMLVGGIMKSADLLGDGLGKLGGGTDGMTTLDAILGSSFFSWNVGLINGFGGKTIDTFTKDEDIFANVGSSYTGSSNKFDEAAHVSGKKYGLVSNSARKKAERLVWNSKNLLNILSDISNESTDRRNIMASMSAINSNKRRFEMLGGYNQASVRVGKSGLKFEALPSTEEQFPITGILPIKKLQVGGELPPKKISIEGNLPTKIYKLGGTLPNSKYDIFVESLPDNLKPKDGDDYNMRLLWELNGKPENFNNVKGIIFEYDKKDKLWHAPSVAYDKEKDEYIFLKSPNHPTYNEELKWYFSDKAAEFRKKYKYDPVSNKYLPNISKPIESFKNGGEFNVIPDGSLHSRKHNMDIDGITKKGIPVVDNYGELTAEIEKNEIILRLEVTEKLEALNKIYQSAKPKDKEEAALEAGKLLVFEILHNTKDNTNLINEI